MDWLGLIALVLWVLFPAAVFISKNAVKAWIEKGIQHDFDQQIEKVRSELRKQEETFKSELRSKEHEITTLRDIVLSGRANRQALVDKRRIEAVERLWKAVHALAPYKGIAGTMAAVNFEAASKRTPTDAKLRQVFEMYGRNVPELKEQWENPAVNEQPFLSPLAWAYFSAYQGVVFLAYIKLKMLQLGIETPEKLINIQSARDLVAAALPDYAEYVQQHDPYYVLDELERRLLEELRAVEKATSERNRQIAQAAGMDTSAGGG